MVIKGVKMNKAQINFFINQTSIIKNRIITKHKELLPDVPNLSVSEMASMIHNGVAKFKIDLFASNNCPSFYSIQNNLEGLYEYPNDDLRYSARLKRSDIINNTMDKILRYIESICQDFVLDRIEDPKEILENIEKLIFFNYKDIHNIKKGYDTLGCGYLLEDLLKLENI